MESLKCWQRVGDVVHAGAPECESGFILTVTTHLVQLPGAVSRFGLLAPARRSVC